MKQQKGAALVIVMALLSGALVIGMSGMQSSLIDEQLAGNYRASVTSQMNGERYLTDVISDENRENLNDFLLNARTTFEEGEEKKLSSDELALLVGYKSEINDNMTVVVSRGDDDQITFDVWATVEDAKSPIKVAFSSNGAAENFRSPFLACSKINLTGSSFAASCNSSETDCSYNLSTLKNNPNYPDFSSPYESSESPVFVNPSFQNYNLLYNLGTVQGDSINLSGNAHIYGNVRSQRDIVLTGSSSIKGDAYAQKAIIHGGDTRDTGKQVSEIEGSTQRCDAFLNAPSLSDRIDEITQQHGSSIGSVTMGAYPSLQWALTPQGLFYYSQASRNCGFLGLRCLLEDLITFTFSLLGFDACALTVINCRGNQVGWVKYADVVNNTIVVNNLRLVQEPTFIVAGTRANQHSNPARLRIVVEGEFSVGGGGNGIYIEDNASLEVFVKGQASLNSNLQMGDTSSTRNGQVPLTINSIAYGNAVSLNGSSHLVGNIYAPAGGVTLNASRVTGSIWAQEINALDDSPLIFNEFNAIADGQNVQPTSNNDDSTGFSILWE